MSKSGLSLGEVRKTGLFWILLEWLWKGDSIMGSGSQGAWECISWVFEGLRNQCLEVSLRNAKMKPGQKPGCMCCNSSRLPVNLKAWWLHQLLTRSRLLFHFLNYWDVTLKCLVVVVVVAVSSLKTTGAFCNGFQPFHWELILAIFSLLTQLWKYFCFSLRASFSCISWVTSILKTKCIECLGSLLCTTWSFSIFSANDIRRDYVTHLCYYWKWVCKGELGCAGSGPVCALRSLDAVTYADSRNPQLKEVTNGFGLLERKCNSGRVGRLTRSPDPWFPVLRTHWNHPGLSKKKSSPPRDMNKDLNRDFSKLQWHEIFQ